MKKTPKAVTLSGVVEHEFSAKFQTHGSVSYIASISAEGIVVRPKNRSIEFGLVPWEQILDRSVTIATRMKLQETKVPRRRTA